MSLGTRNQYEEDLAECAAMAKWQLDRANSVEADRASARSRAQPDRRPLRCNAKDDVMNLGSRLFHDRRGPIELYASRDYSGGEPRTSSPDTPTDPEKPAGIVRRLESTTEGCRWLLDRWRELRELIDSPVGWLPPQKLKAIRLLGKQPLQAGTDDQVASVFLACHVIKPFLSVRVPGTAVRDPRA